MPTDAASQSAIASPIYALAILLAFGVFAALAHFGMRYAVRSRRISGDRRVVALEARVIEALRKPLIVALALIGVLAALTWLNQTTFPLFANTRQVGQWLHQAWLIVIVGVLCYAAARLAHALLRWQLVANYAEATPALRSFVLPMLNRTIGASACVIGGLIALNILGIPITPLLATIGIGGLAVALALSPTLTSYIAGTFVVAEGQIKEGDYIELDVERAGFVEKVGWRSAIIRSRFNNLIIVPNSIITDSIVTNYSAPNPAVTGMVTCGVSYDSNLRRVEEIALEIARKAIEESEDADKEFEPIMRYFEFGDSNIGFNLVFRATDRAGLFALTHEIIIRLHERFGDERIEISYPVRKLDVPANLGYLPVGQPPVDGYDDAAPKHKPARSELRLRRRARRRRLHTRRR